jgi:non-heme chloroperoxidase
MKTNSTVKGLALLFAVNCLLPLTGNGQSSSALLAANTKQNINHLTPTTMETLAIEKPTATTTTTGSRAAVGRKEFIEVETNLKLHVTDLGEGRPVVLIHGWPLSDAMYEYQYQYLMKQGFRVIGITLRGFGQSDKPFGQYNYDVFADDIKAVLDELKIENAVLGGFSMGGATAIHYVARHKGAHISKLALFGAAAPAWTKSADSPIGASKSDVDGLIALNNTNRPKLLEVFGGIFTGSENSIPAGQVAWLGTINLQASSYAMEQCLILLRDADLRNDLSRVKVPTAIFHGKKDKICPFELSNEMHKGIVNSYVVPFENSGHALFLEELDKFNAELLKFCNQ